MTMTDLSAISKKKSEYIKIIAIFTMFIDHLGFIIYPDQIIYRIIGRIAFPLFAFQLSVGFQHTSNIVKHFIKLLIFALIIQIGYSLIIIHFNANYDLKILNIVFTLLLGFLLIYLYDKKRYFLMLITLLIPFSAQYSYGLEFEYGLYGVAMILLMYIVRKNPVTFVISITLLTFLNCVFIENPDYFQMYSVLAFIFIIKPIEFNINIPNNFFYYFYPLHLIFLYALSYLI
jgi:hypothetical protein